MGFALADEAARRGARVILVAGPVQLSTPPGVERVNVTTAREMEAAVRGHAQAADMVVMTAAVADYRPRNPAGAKIKKENGPPPPVELEENPDILAGLRDVAPRAVIVGFAAETHDLERNALTKLERKRADFLVANDVSRKDIAFDSLANEVTVFRREGEPVFLSRRPKQELAASLLDLFAGRLGV
jgi:phosphopantothenoylcysteine decarboxylase/phosphopantothenate--cysteine ligase